MNDRQGTAMGAPIEVILISDDRFVTQVAVTLLSAAQHCSRPIRATVIAMGYRPEHARALQSLPGIEVDVVPADASLVTDLPISFRFQSVTYMRLFFDQLISRPIGTCLYLDADLLVRGDLAELVDLDLGDNILGAVQDWWISWYSRPNGIVNYRELGRAPDDPYLNAGVLLLDLERWRSTGFCDDMRTYLTEHVESLRHNDQDPLNVCSHGRWLHLEPRWNVQLHALPGVPVAVVGTDGQSTGFSEMLYAADVLDRAVSDPSIVHFSGAAKPWAYGAEDTVAYARDWVATARRFDPTWAAPAPVPLTARQRIARRLQVTWRAAVHGQQ